MATVGPTNLPAFFNVDADFRTWGSTISAALATLGLVQTGDTGQINWTTVTKPSAASTSQGYEVWRFADALQGTVPVFIKLEYGSGVVNADRPGLWITVGSGSNGSGTLTGQLGTRTQVAASASKVAGVSLPFYASGDSGQLMLAVNVDIVTSSFGFFLGVERPKDNTNTRQGIGVVWTQFSNTSASTQYVPASGTVPGVKTTNMCAACPSYWGLSGSGANADASPIFVPVSGAWYYSGLLITATGDFPAGGTLTTTIFGGSHSYMAMNQTGVQGTTWVNSLAAGFAFPWE